MSKHYFKSVVELTQTAGMDVSCISLFLPINLDQDYIHNLSDDNPPGNRPLCMDKLIKRRDVAKVSDCYNGGVGDSFSFFPDPTEISFLTLR